MVKHDQRTNKDPNTWQPTLIWTLLAQDQQLNTWCTLYLGHIGCGSDPQGKMMHTLDNTSKIWTKVVCENVGVALTQGYQDKGCRWECKQ